MTAEKITRRAALKAILASMGGISALAFLPSRWVKPVVESGVLPAHAQTSGDPYKIEASLVDGTITVYAYYPGGFTYQSGHKHLASPAQRMGIPAENKEIKVYKVEDKGSDGSGPYTPSKDKWIFPWIGYKDTTDPDGEFSVMIDPNGHNPVRWGFRGDNGSTCTVEYLS
jgi:hypothetical protein